MLYKYKNYALVLDDGKGRFYKDGQLMFKGDVFISIKFMIEHCESEEVNSWFKSQLESREKITWESKNEVK